jgi:hypothetical protein
LPVEIGAVGVAEGGELGAALGLGDVVRKYQVSVRAGRGLSVSEMEGGGCECTYRSCGISERAPRSQL